MRVFSSMNSVVVHKVRFIFAWFFIFLEMEEYTLHRGAFFQFPFWWIYYYGSNKSTGKEIGKTHLCAVSKMHVAHVTYYSMTSMGMIQTGTL